MNRINYINDIITYASRFVLEVEAFNASNLYDINIHAEGFLIPVLNEVFGLRLENLNVSQKRNFPAVDLADFKSRVAFQVTATSDMDKIKDTLIKFKEHKLNTYFDVLYIYIITHKKAKYSDDRLKLLIPEEFHFIASENIIDKDDLVKKITSLSSTTKIESLAKIYQHEFSEFQLEMRQKQYVNGCLNTESEPISPNFLRISFPDFLYQAELNIDSESILNDLNDFLISIGKKPIKSMKPTKLIKQALKNVGSKAGEWVYHENYLYTFRDLTENSEPIRKILDVGTITKLSSKDFPQQNEDKSRVFKHLLRKTLIEFCKLKEIEWYGPQEIFRFSNNQKMPNLKKVKWKGKKEATKTVIFEMHNKKEGHIICYRSLAFKSSFLNIDNLWYMTINPTWSFTNPGGYDTSRFEPDYMSGIKRLEANGSVYNYFRFFSYYFSHKDLFTPSYNYLTIHPNENLSISPKLQEKAWKPVKVADKNIVDVDIDFKTDNELLDTSLF